MEMQYLIGTVFRNAQGGGKSKTPDPFTPQREAGDFRRATPADGASPEMPRVMCRMVGGTW